MHLSLLKTLKLNLVGNYPTVPHPLNMHLSSASRLLDIVLHVAEETELKVQILLFRSLEYVKIMGNKCNERGKHEVFMGG